MRFVNNLSLSRCSIVRTNSLAFFFVSFWWFIPPLSAGSVCSMKWISLNLSVLSSSYDLTSWQSIQHNKLSVTSQSELTPTDYSPLASVLRMNTAPRTMFINIIPERIAHVSIIISSFRRALGVLSLSNFIHESLDLLAYEIHFWNRALHYERIIYLLLAVIASSCSSESLNKTFNFKHIVEPSRLIMHGLFNSQRALSLISHLYLYWLIRTSWMCSRICIYVGRVVGGCASGESCREPFLAFNYTPITLTAFPISLMKYVDFRAH